MSGTVLAHAIRPAKGPIQGHNASRDAESRAGSERPHMRYGICSNEWEMAGSSEDMCGKVRTVTIH